jgi:hypothetical protein
MKVMLLFQGTADEAEGDPAERAATSERIGAWWGEHVAAGTITGGDELLGPSAAKRVVPGPRGVVTDGPFAEASEVVGGYALLEVPSVDAAVALARTWPGGPVEVRPIRERPDM